jgi:hypothetical protein
MNPRRRMAAAQKGLVGEGVTAGTGRGRFELESRNRTVTGEAVYES